MFNVQDSMECMDRQMAIEENNAFNFYCCLKHILKYEDLLLMPS